MTYSEELLVLQIEIQEMTLSYLKEKLHKQSTIRKSNPDKSISNVYYIGINTDNGTIRPERANTIQVTVTSQYYTLREASLRAKGCINFKWFKTKEGLSKKEAELIADNLKNVYRTAPNNVNTFVNENNLTKI